jgi:hypothetical protein
MGGMGGGGADKVVTGVEGGCEGTKAGWVAGGRDTEEGEGAEGRWAGMTAHLQPRFGCDGTEVLVAPASCACTSVF